MSQGHSSASAVRAQGQLNVSQGHSGGSGRADVDRGLARRERRIVAAASRHVNGRHGVNRQTTIDNRRRNHLRHVTAASRHVNDRHGADHRQTIDRRRTHFRHVTMNSDRNRAHSLRRRQLCECETDAVIDSTGALEARHVSGIRSTGMAARRQGHTTAAAAKRSHVTAAAVRADGQRHVTDETTTGAVVDRRNLVARRRHVTTTTTLMGSSDHDVRRRRRQPMPT